MLRAVALPPVHSQQFVSFTASKFVSQVGVNSDFVTRRREKFAKIAQKWTEVNARMVDLAHEEVEKRVAAKTTVVSG
jgi:hypothetical protein